MQLTSKITKKASNGAGFVLEGQEGWFNANAQAKVYLAGIPEGTIVTIDYEKKGIKREVNKIVAGTSSVVVSESSVKECSVCGKALKNPAFPTCFTCKDKAPKKESVAVTTSLGQGGSVYVPKGSSYGSPEDVVGKEVGCASGCAASILAGRQEQPDVLLEMFRILCDGILEHMRAIK